MRRKIDENNGEKEERKNEYKSNKMITTNTHFLICFVWAKYYKRNRKKNVFFLFLFYLLENALPLRANYNGYETVSRKIMISKS